MSLQAERLTGLIEFCHQSARLRGRPTATVSSHGIFSFHENDLSGIPGVRLNVLMDGEDEIWLSVDRLHKTKPPEVTSEWLRPWMVVAPDPNEEPTLKKAVSRSSLADEGAYLALESERLKADPEELVSLDDYAESERVRSLFQNYIETKWTFWANEEKRRLKTISLYAQLFTLKQQLEGSIVEAQLELVWGVGIGVWKTNDTIVSYPIIGQLVELSLNPASAALEVRPRNVEPQVELDWYAAQDNPGVADLEKAAKKFLEELPNTFTPFDCNTYEPLLRSAVTHLDANGVYWPSQVQPEDRTVPRAEDKLKVTDSWVLFARPRTNSAYLQDLERLKTVSEGLDEFPPAIAAIVTDPDTKNPEYELPAFRGVSASYHGASGSPLSHKAQDLYFPKPFNDEQVKIIQLLELHDGVIVQGPPGTGKTHTIANIICHFLANGKRVLVTSMKDPALSVLQEQLPDEIKPLAISLLTSEQEGLKKFEHSIRKIASEVQNIDRSATAKEIRHLEESIDALHGQLAKIDWDISTWGKKNLNKITIDSTDLDAKDAAHELVANHGSYEWIFDPIKIAPEFEPRFNDADVIALRDARKDIGFDIAYLNASLPQIIEFPDSKSILQTHQDLSKFTQLRKEVEAGGVPSLANTRQQTIDAALLLHERTDKLRQLRFELQSLGKEWLALIKQRLKNRAQHDVVCLLNQLGEELKEAQERRKGFLSKPISMPDGLESNQELSEAVKNLSDGKRAFGLSGLLGKSEEKKSIESIQILGTAPRSADEWRHVADYLGLLGRMKELGIRWNAIATELDLPIVDSSPYGGQQAYDFYLIFQKVENEVELEHRVLADAKTLFPSWTNVDSVISSLSSFNELEQALRHHLTENRLANVWGRKEQFQRVLDGRNGPVIDQIHDFLNHTLGYPSVSDNDMQAAWSRLVAELSRVLGTRSKLDVIQRVTGLIKDSGAPIYAARLQEPISGMNDELLPNDWRRSWKLKRLATYLDEIDGQEELKRLSRRRRTVETDLAKTYQNIVVKRTWLKLAENASPSIRASLQAYLSAIQKIGKGTGKRAVRYRQDARNAASQANAAVPCWIMPHYRVSESLPPDIGCFDLVIIDEASQSDLTALPALLRAEKVLIVGDDKQVSPEGVGLEEEKIRNLISRFLGNQVETYRPLMSPERSIYDLFKVVYAKSSVMLKEHFRCVGPIIEYSKREFYNHELRPLRLPKASERLDPPLIDVLVQDGYREGDINRSEARFIVEEVKKIVADERLFKRSIGIVSLLANKQAFLIWDMLSKELGPELLQRHDIACGDARTFQGKERDIMFLSMVIAPNESRITALSRDAYTQRFNVAASRARDRMYLVRSVSAEHLSEADKLRRSLITHFSTPFVQDENRQEDLRELCESDFEREVYDALIERGYWITPQVKVGQFRIDMVVEGNNDQRLAVECDGDKYHGPDKWADDMHRQRILERAGWIFWRCFASNWVRRKAEMIDDLVKTLNEHGIEPLGSECAPRSIHCEQRVLLASELGCLEQPRQQAAQDFMDEPSAPTITEIEIAPIESAWTEPPSSIGPSFAQERSASLETEIIPHIQQDLQGDPRIIRRLSLEVQEYCAFTKPLSGDPREVNEKWIANSLIKIIAVEGPVIAKRACDIYLRSVGVKRMGHEIKATMTEALRIVIFFGGVEAINETTDTDVMSHTLRLSGSPALVIRTRGNRSFEEITPSEVQFIARYIARREDLDIEGDNHLRAILEFFDLKRLTTQVGTSVLDILGRRLPHVDAALESV